MLPYTVNRYRYNVETTTSLESDPLYGIAKVLAPTAIYFNTRFFDQAGVTIIDETEESIEAYNAVIPTPKRRLWRFMRRAANAISIRRLR